MPRLAQLLLVSVTLVGCSRDVELEGREPLHRLSCPRPGKLPFDAASMFVDPSHADLHGPVADVASDTLGNLGGRVSSTDEPLDAEPEARNVFYVGRKARRAAAESSTITPIAGEAVSLWYFDVRTGVWQWTGRDTTDEDGGYRFIDTVAERPPLEPLYAVLEGDGSCAAHYDALYPEETPVVVTEIDGTLDRGAKGTDSAARTMRAWADKGYPIVYLTMRSRDDRASTRAWLDESGFPTGALVTPDAAPPGTSAYDYKRVWLDRMHDVFGWRFVAAYTAAWTDVEAYRDGGAGAARVFLAGASEPDGCVGLEDFDAHRADFVDAQPDAP